MYIKDDSESTTILDRVISAAIAGVLGYLFGVLVAKGVMAIFGNGAWIKWCVSLGFAIYAFLAPNRSRELWGGFWEEAWSILRGNR